MDYVPRKRHTPFATRKFFFEVGRHFRKHPLFLKNLRIAFFIAYLCQSQRPKTPFSDVNLYVFGLVAEDVVGTLYLAFYDLGFLFRLAAVKRLTF